MSNDEKVNITTPAEVNQTNSNEVDLFYAIEILWKQKKVIIVNVFVVSILAAIITLIMPKSFQSSAVLMPPSQNQGSSILSSLANLPLGILGAESGDETMSLIAILKSRTVMEDVVNKFNLIELYQAEDIEETVVALRNNVSFTIEEEGTIIISVNVGTDWFHPEAQEERARSLSANMTNYFVEQLDLVNKGLQTQQASFQRMFIEGRYFSNIEDLKKAEDSLKAFQQESNMIELGEQTKAAIEIAALIKGQILADEVQLGVMTTILNPDSPELSELRKEISELKRQLREMDYGSANSLDNENKLFPMFSEVPELGVQLMRLTRNVEVQNTLFMFLTQQYEEAKIQEARNTPTVQVLDKANVPIRKHTPQRTLIVIIVMLLTFILTSSAILVINEKRIK